MFFISIVIHLPFCFCGLAAACTAKRRRAFCLFASLPFDVLGVCGSIGLCGRSLRLVAGGLLFRLCGLLLFFLRQPLFMLPGFGRVIVLLRLRHCQGSQPVQLLLLQSRP
jgi:hypothetical protein